MLSGDGRPTSTASKPPLDKLFSWARRSKRSYWISYTVLFVLVALVCFLPLIVSGKHLMAKVDGLNQSYVNFTYFGWWIRQIVKLSVDAHALVVPVWDLSFGMGGDEFMNRCAGFFSPFSYIAVFFPSRYAEWGFDLAVILGLYCAGLGFSLFALGRGNGRFQTLVGALSYAFSGWAILVLMQFAYFKPMIGFPLLLWAAERVFKRKSPVPFLVMSALTLLNGVMFAYMEFIFLAVYCVMLYLEYEQDRGVASFAKWLLYFLGMILVTVVIAAIVLIPQVSGITSQSRMKLERVIPLLFDVNYYVSLVNGFMGYKELSTGGALAGGCLALVSCVLVFRDKKIGVNKTWGVRVAFILLVICLCVPRLGSVLNGFQYASSRWVFIFLLCLSYCITVAAPRVVDIRKEDFKPLCIVTLIVGAFVVLKPSGILASAFVGLCLTVLLLVLLWLSCSSKLGMRLDANARRAALLIVAIVNVAAPFYSHCYLGTGISDRVDAGSAWVRHTAYSIASAVKEVDDDTLWRYDCYGVPRLYNGSVLNQLYSFDYYTSYYDNNVNQFFFDLEISDSQTVHRIENLTKRSYLESALGAKYFVVGDELLAQQRADLSKRVEPADKPAYSNLPYGASDEPVATKNVRLWPRSAKWPYYVFENTEALPLAYTFSNALDEDDYESLSATQKQQALLQALAVEDPDPSMTIGKDELEFDDLPVSYSVASTTNARVEDHAIVAEKKGATVTLELEDCAPGELYVELLDFTYEKKRPQLADDASFSDWCTYIKSAYSWVQAKDYEVNVATEKGRTAYISGKTKYSNMYGGDDSNILNLGYIKTPTERVTLTFGGAGTYSFDEINVIVQPMDNLDKFVSERRTYPVELTQGVNSFTAKVDNGEDQILFLSLPWSKGWSATVDGEPAEIGLADNAFMAIDLPAGDHVVDLRYETPGLKLGLAISALGLVLAVAVVLAYRKVTGAARRKQTRR